MNYSYMLLSFRLITATNFLFIFFFGGGGGGGGVGGGGRGGGLCAVIRWTS